LLDPRTRLFLAICGAAVVVGTGKPEHLALEWAALAAGVAYLRAMGEYRRWLMLVVPMSVFFGAVTAWSTDLQSGAVAGGKLVVLASVFFLFFKVTIPEDLANALVKCGLPFSVAFVVSASMQFVPVIARKAGCVMDALRSRGLPLEPGRSAIRHFPSFLAPLLIQCLRMAEELAEAMASRGFGRPGRTFYRDYRIQARDWLAMILGAVVSIAILVAIS
jgi:energy-coupling factor transport system permease protein